jgi:tetratricopeptide (TPR) repeat protein
MTKKKEKTEEKIEAVEQALTRSERFLVENQKPLMIVISAIIVVVLAVLGYQKFIVQPGEEKAQNEIFVAQGYFEQDSLYKALHGDGRYAGFLEIIDNYGSTPTGNLARYYAGICYLKLGEFENAIKNLKKYSSGDPLTSAMALGGIGDAYLELGKNEKAISYYTKAAKKENELTSPAFLMKAAMTSELVGNYKKALEMYETIRTTYPRSAEGRDIDRYISKAKGMLK